MSGLKSIFSGSKKSSKADAEQRLQQQRKHILSAKSDFYTREAYKALRTNIIFALAKEGCRKVCVTSSQPSEGKSISCLNLALSFAETGSRVLLIDADMRKPNQGRLLKKKSAPGLSNLLANLCALEEVIHKDAREHLDVIFAGDIPPNPSELLGAPRMEQLLQELESQYDYIFVDTPPVNVVTDAIVVARWLDGVVFVVRQGVTEADEVSNAMGQLNFAEIKVLGFVLNGTKLEGRTKNYNKYKVFHKYNDYGYRQGNYGYGYGYGYGRPGYGYGYGRTVNDARFQFTQPTVGVDRQKPEGGSQL